MRTLAVMVILAIAPSLSTPASADYQLKMTLPEGTAVWGHAGATEEGLYDVGANLDLDGDGRRDVVAERWFWEESPPSYRMEVYGTPDLNLLWASSRFSSQLPTPTFYGFYDIDGNGKKEVLFRIDEGNYQYVTVAVDWTDPNNTVLWSARAQLRSIWDVDGDGIDDILISNRDTGRGEIWGHVSSATAIPGSEPRNEDLDQITCAPDPSNGSTTVRYRLRATGAVDIMLFNARGLLIRRLLCQIQDAGEHSVKWDFTDDSGRAVPSGIYLCRIASDGKSSAAKVTLVR